MVDKVHTRGFTDQGSYDPTDKLIAGEGDFQSRKETLAAGQNLERGALQGQLTAGGEVTLYTAGATNGAENVYGVLLHSVDATAAASDALVYTGGVFSEQEIIAKTAGLTAVDDALRLAARSVGIIIKRVVE